MGLIISRFRRKKSTEETLYELDKKLKSMDEYGRSTEQTRRRVVGNLMIASVGLYVLAVLIFYLYCRPATWTDTVFYSSPLLVSPLLIVLLRAAIARYYDWKLRRNRSRLQVMRTEKKRILEEVMDKETYKVAMGILAKFANTEMEKPQIQLARPLSAPSKSLLPALNNAVATPSQLRQRQLQGPLTGTAPSPQRALMPASPNQLTPLKGDQLPRPIMNSNTSGAFERLVDYLIGDGPGSRYALICSNCKSHNGMAMPEEFEYVAYRCAYCRHPNAARKTRPRPPQLMSTPINTDTSDHKSSSESEDSEEEKTPSKTPEPSSNNSPNKTVEMAESPPPADDVPEDMSIDEPSENHSSDAGDKKKTD